MYGSDPAKAHTHVTYLCQGIIIAVEYQAWYFICFLQSEVVRFLLVQSLDFHLLEPWYY